MKEDKYIGFFWIILAVILIAFMTFKINGNSGNDFIKIGRIEIGTHVKTGGLLFTKKYSAAEISSIDINLTSESIIVENSYSDEIIVEVYAAEQDAPEVNVIDSVLEITGSKTHFNIRMNQKIIVKLPGKYKPKDFDISLSSGNVRIKDCIIPECNCQLSSGTFFLQDSEILALNTKTTSGSIKIENCRINELEAKTSSGSISADGSFDRFEIQATSGIIKMNLKKPFAKDSEILATSGSIRIVMPHNSNFVAKYDVKSGTYKNNINGTRGKTGTDITGTGGPVLELRATSGTIKIDD